MRCSHPCVGERKEARDVDTAGGSQPQVLGASAALHFLWSRGVVERHASGQRGAPVRGGGGARVRDHPPPRSMSVEAVSAGKLDDLRGGGVPAPGVRPRGGRVGGFGGGLRRPHTHGVGRDAPVLARQRAALEAVGGAARGACRAASSVHGAGARRDGRCARCFSVSACACGCGR
jgi:hypothetical protein